MEKYVKAKPLSRDRIRRFAVRLREILGLCGKKNINVLTVLEHLVPMVDEDFHFEVLEDNLLPNDLARACPDEHKIEIRESVYIGALNGDGYHRFTIIHELGHYLLHSSDRIIFARSTESIKRYEDPEWQADVFAGEFLMPPNIIQGMSIEDISRTCGVTRKAAKVQYNVNKK